MRIPVPDRSRPRLRTITTIVATALVIAPATALATHGFTDVDDGEFLHGAVDWLKDSGVTVGCNPPNNTRFCPDDFVTRGEMAVFLERLDSQDVFLRPGEATTGSGSDGGDADTLDGKDSTAFLGTGAKAADADKLDGKDSSAFLGATERAVDADTVDGKHASDFYTRAVASNLFAFKYHDHDIVSDSRSVGSPAPGSTETMASATISLPERCSLIRPKEHHQLRISASWQVSDLDGFSATGHLKLTQVSTGQTWTIPNTDTDSQIPNIGFVVQSASVEVFIDAQDADRNGTLEPIGPGNWRVDLDVSNNQSDSVNISDANLVVESRGVDCSK